MLPPSFSGVSFRQTYGVSKSGGNLCHAITGFNDSASKQMSDVRVIVDTLVAIAFMEAIVKPVVTRLTKKALGWADQYFHFIPDWLHHAPSSPNCQADPCQEQKAQDQQKELP